MTPNGTLAADFSINGRPPPEPEKLRLIGRSSSHFTRVVRIFAAELEIDYAFQVVPNLMSDDTQDYAGNPALRLPILETASGTWFGSLNICRELARQSQRTPRLIWPENLDQPLLANAQEFALQAMATEVSLIMAGVGRTAPDSPHQAKLKTSLANMVSWLNSHVNSMLAALPARDLSFLEVTLYCLVTHLEFRGVLAITPYRELAEFCQQFGARAAAHQTAYHFDV